MGFFQEFKEFAVRGNVVDLAVGLIMGASFGKVVTSVVENVVMPPIGMLVGGVNFTNLKVTLKEAEGAAPAVALEYGKFIQNLVDFTIVAFSVFLLVKAINTMRAKLEKDKKAGIAPPPPLSRSEELLTEIRDTLKAKPA